MAEFTFNVETNLVLDTRELDHVLNDPSGEVGQFLAKRGRAILFAAKRQVGKDTRALELSLHMLHQRIGGIQQIWIGSDNRIAFLHHEGSRPHAIEARNAQMLRFSSRGRMVYTRAVMHPGTKPNHYLTDNLYLVYL
jgi:hypothetical protein